MRKTAQNKNDRPSLSPESKKMLAAALAAAAGGATGSYVAGQNHRVLGAVTGAGLGAGAALASDPIAKAVIKALGKTHPAPKHSWKPSGWDIAGVSAAALPFIPLSLAPVGKNNFEGLATALADKARAARSAEEAAAADTLAKFQELLAQNDPSKLTAKGAPAKGLLARLFGKGNNAPAVDPATLREAQNRYTTIKNQVRDAKNQLAEIKARKSDAEIVKEQIAKLRDRHPSSGSFFAKLRNRRAVSKGIKSLRDSTQGQAVLHAAKNEKLLGGFRTFMSNPGIKNWGRYGTAAVTVATAAGLLARRIKKNREAMDRTWGD